MDTLYDFCFKQKKYMPVFPKAIGKPTVYIEGYPFEDDEPMAATGFHGVQITTLFDQLSGYFAINDQIHIGIDNFIYYQEGDITKFVAPDVYVVFGVDKHPQRRSFYTWSEGTAPVTVFEFLSDSTLYQDRNVKIKVYLQDMGVQEYFIHQPEMDKPAEFRGWERNPSGNISEIGADSKGGLFSNSLNLMFRWEAQSDSHVRLLRPYLPDGTPILTSMEEKLLLRQEQTLREAAEMKAEEEVERRRTLEAEVERLRAQITNTQDE